MYIYKENSLKTRKKCSSTTLRALKLRFTQNKKIIWVNIEFFYSIMMALIHLHMSKNIIHINILRVPFLPNSAVETTMKVSLDGTHQSTMHYRHLTCPSSEREQASVVNNSGCWWGAAQELKFKPLNFKLFNHGIVDRIVHYSEKIQVCCISEGQTKKTPRLFIPDKWWKGGAQGPASKECLTVMIQVPIRWKSQRIKLFRITVNVKSRGGGLFPGLSCCSFLYSYIECPMRSNDELLLNFVLRKIQNFWKKMVSCATYSY